MGPAALDYFLEELNTLQHVYIHLERKLEDLDYYEDWDYIIHKLLEGVCNTEVLKLSFDYLEVDDKGWEIYHCWESNKAISCVTCYLKTVEPFDVEGFENDLKLVNFLLKNGHVLEKMTINWGMLLENPGQIIPKIMEFPRSSSIVS